MPVVLTNAKRVTNMNQVKKIYEGNEAALRENEPQHSRKNLTVTKLC